MDTRDQFVLGKGRSVRVVATLAAIMGLSALLVAAAALIRSGSVDGSAGAATETPPAEVTAETVGVELDEFTILPAAVSAAAGADLTVAVRNVGGAQHDLVIEGGEGTELLDPETEATLHLGALEVGEYTLFCSVPGHRDLGMSTTLTVAEGAVSGGEPPPAMHEGHDDEAYMAGIEAFPAETEGIGNQLMEPVRDGDVLVYELTADEIEWEVAPGDVRSGMAYNGQIPGPQIRVNLGDRVRIVLHNELEESTSIHYHGLVVPNSEDGVPGLTQPLVRPGESYTYEFTVVNSGSHMYHSHMNGANQIPGGLLGAFIVDDGDEPEVDQDILMVLNDGPLGYSINGKGFPATQPIVAAAGERVRIRYMNEGLQIHPMHLHGMPQTVIAKDGYDLPEPYLADTVLVAPGERVDVLVDATELGLWAFHCHVLTHAEGPDGMFGMVTAMIVEE